MNQGLLMISDELWKNMLFLLPGKDGDPGATGSNTLMFPAAVFWCARTGSP